ncbi:MAG: sporulation protein YqfD, partial [Clostridiales bacterium]|nr:sporulation protein YqfD [Clostridiales bacterium]
MKLSDIWNYMKGYVIIKVDGIKAEKFINICIKRSINIWKVNREKDETYPSVSYSMRMGTKDFKRNARPVAKKARCRVKIQGKRGLLFTIKHYKKRKVLAAGGIAAIILFFILSSLLWNINITGSDESAKLRAQKTLEQMGIKPGVSISKIDIGLISDRILEDQKQLTWVGVSLKGTKLKIVLNEGTENPQIIDKNMPCDVVALKDGYVYRVIVKDGKAVVKENTPVFKGDVLISGSVAGADEKVGPRLVHAQGEVYAKIWYTYTTKVELQEKIIAATG